MSNTKKTKSIMTKKARTSPLEDSDYCYNLQPTVDHQGSKVLFRAFRWIGACVIEKVLPNEIYVVRRINTRKTQTLHQIRLRKYNSDKPLDDSYQHGNFQRLESIVVSQDNLYTIAWKTEFVPIFDKPIPYQDPNMIDSNRNIDNEVPNDTEHQKTDDSANLTLDPVVDRQTSQDVGQSTISDQISDLISENHAKRQSDTI